MTKVIGVPLTLISAVVECTTAVPRDHAIRAGVILANAEGVEITIMYGKEPILCLPSIEIPDSPTLRERMRE